jgi:histidyl-tRNA synthetase
MSEQDAFKSPKSMRDLLPGDVARQVEDRVSAFQHLEAVSREIFRRYGFDEVRTPMVEHTEVFARGVGEGTDIVQKEMFTLTDDGGRSLTLRPEGTAGAVRALVEHNVFTSDPLTKWFYVGPMFRQERPQRGRYRQFHQIGAEAFGAAGPQIDAELIDLARAFFSELGLEKLTFRVNSLGDAVCRPKYLSALVSYLRSRSGELCKECQARLDRNPLRILDCKDDAAKPVIANAPTMIEFLCDPCKDHFAELKTLLGLISLPYQVDPRIVRGLDYYTRTVFEVLAPTGEDALGSQNAVCGGGRYDDLVRRFGGPDVPAIGFAIGMDRLAILLRDKLPAVPLPDLFLVSVGDAARRESYRLARTVRGAGLSVELDERGGSVKSQMRRADKRKARFTAVVGDTELQSGRVKLKRMLDGVERDVALAQLAAAVREP